MGKKFKVDIDKMNGFTREEKRKFKAAVELLEDVINSREFYLDMANASFDENRGMSGIDIYNHIMSGKDLFNDEPDRDLDLHVTMYFKDNNVIGYTYKNTWKTWINRRYFRKASLADICKNIIHEYCHNLGYRHSYHWLPRRKYTVPYGVGYLVRDLAREID